jgi:mannose-6-phosphate isomerase-like protein (cupin superfamily)
MGEPKGYVVDPDGTVDPEDPGLKASAASTGGALTLYASRTTGGAPPHVHEREDECFYVVSGRITVDCGDEHWEAGPGSFVFLPRRIPHAWDVPGGEESVVLIITVPGGFEEFMQEFHEAADDERGAVAARHGITMLGG